MAKVNVTYNAPEGDNAVVTTGGKRFFDGLPLELDSDEYSELIERLRGNPHFDVDAAETPAAPPPAQTWGNS